MKVVRALSNLIIILLLIAPAKNFSQELLPFIENFTKTDYSGDNQVWSIVQGNDKALYFANNHFMLRYNGVKWEKFTLPDKTIIRSVFADGDRIYCGSYKEFGYWQRQNGQMKYTSLSGKAKLFAGSADNEEIWKIFKHDNTIYFQAFNELYAYKDDKVEKLKFPSLVSYCYVIDNKIFAATVRNGVYELKNNTFHTHDAWPQLKETVVHGIEKCGNELFVFTKNNGIFRGNEKGITPLAGSINGILKHDAILSAKVVDSNTIAVGTAVSGLYIIDIKTGIYKNINRTNGLKNNTVLSMLLDKENNLWLGLDNGIAQVEINTPVSLFTDTSGMLGSVYSIASYNNGFLFATNHGLFTYSNNALKEIPQSQGQSWYIYPEGNKFIVGHNDGTFVFDGTVFKKANPVNGGWNFQKSIYDNAYFQPNYSGITIYKDLNKLNEWQILAGITKPIKTIAQVRKGELWAADNYRGLYRLLYDKDFSIKKVENVSEKNKLASDFAVKIFNYRNTLFFYINNTWYTYNNVEDRLEKHAVFNRAFTGISDILPVDDNVFIVIKNNLLYTITSSNGSFIWKLIPEKYYTGRLIPENMSVYSKDNVLYLNLDDGLVAVNLSQNNTQKYAISIEGYFQDSLITNDTKIAHNQLVTLNISSGLYGYNRPELYYTLNGETPYVSVKNGNIILNSLDSGTQKISIYYYDGLKYKHLKDYSFVVSKPWYFSLYMIIAYIAVFSGILFLYYRWNNMRYRQKLLLHEEELKHRTQIIELEMETENKLRQEQHERHMLEAEVQNKASEVAGKSLSIAKHSEMIESIQEALDAEAALEPLKSKIRKIIKVNTLNKNEWQSFEKNLLKSHQEFVERLNTKYPGLTPKDIKLCIYLKMNLSSKEIAPLMNISYRGVELHRYRLRKKMGVSQEESLNKLMIML